MLKIIVAGSRDLEVTPEDIIKRLDHLKIKPPVTFISGCAKGADTAVIEFAKATNLPCMKFPAKWDDITVPGAVVKTRPDGTKYNAKAGLQRNEEMAKEGDLLIAYWDGKSRGTKHMIDTMRSLNKPTSVVICVDKEEEN